jgi:hypothetical protein
MTYRGGKASIYFIRPIGSEGPVKIGFSIYPASRLVTYQAWSPVPLEVAATIEIQVPENEPQRGYAMAVERRFHHRYRDHWTHHEWFAAHPLLTRDIELIKQGRFSMSDLPPHGPVIRKDVASTWQRGRTAPQQVFAA